MTRLPALGCGDTLLGDIAQPQLVVLSFQPKYEEARSRSNLLLELANLLAQLKLLSLHSLDHGDQLLRLATYEIVRYGSAQ